MGDGTNCDFMTSTHAIEVNFARTESKKWSGKCTGRNCKLCGGVVEKRSDSSTF
jgi:hypothetical protein